MPSTISIRDINADGRPDLIIGNQGSNTVSVLLNTTPMHGASAVSFAAQQTFTVGTGPFGNLGVGDLNGDGRPDIVVADFSGNTMSVLLNNTGPSGSTASFAAQQAFAVASIRPRGSGPI